MAKNPIQIAIDNPCKQDWNKMEVTEQGRYCDHCKKNVIDFTGYSDAALYQFLAKNTGHACGRFLPQQLNRNIAIPPQPHSRLYRLFVGLSLTMLFVPVTQQAYSQVRTPLVNTFPGNDNKNDVLVKTGSAHIKGRIVDEQNNIVDAIVTITQGDTLVTEMLTDSNGYYSFSINPCTYDVSVEAFEYEWGSQRVSIRENETLKLDFALKKIPDFKAVMGGMRFYSAYGIDSCSR